MRVRPFVHMVIVGWFRGVVRVCVAHVMFIVMVDIKPSSSSLLASLSVSLLPATLLWASVALGSLDLPSMSIESAPARLSGSSPPASWILLVLESLPSPCPKSP